MTVYLDTSALVALHLEGPARAVVVTALDGDPDWCSSGLTLMEALALVDRVTEEPVLRSDLEDLVRLSWIALRWCPSTSAASIAPAR